MMMEIEKESRQAAMEDGIEEELDADEQVLAFINSQSTGNLMFVANKLFAFSSFGRNSVDGDSTFISGIREKYGSQASIDARNKIRNRCCIFAVEHSEPQKYYYDGYVFRSGSGEKEEYVHSGNVFYCEFSM